MADIFFVELRSMQYSIKCISKYHTYCNNILYNFVPVNQMPAQPDIIVCIVNPLGIENKATMNIFIKKIITYIIE